MFECPRSPSWLNWKILFSSLIIRTHIHICIYIYIYKNIFVILHRRGKRKAAFVSFRMWNRRRRKQSWCKLCQMYYLAYARLLYLIHSQDGKHGKKQMRARGRAFLAISRLRLLIRFYCTWNEQLNRGISGPFNRAAIFIAYPWRGDPYQSSRVVFAVYPENA